MLMLESFAEFDVDWRNELVGGCPLRNGELASLTGPGSGSSSTRRRSPRILTNRWLSLALGQDMARQSTGTAKAGRRVRCRMKCDLTHRVPIVTGGAGAIGTAIARRLADNRAKVVVAT